LIENEDDRLLGVRVGRAGVGGGCSSCGRPDDVEVRPRRMEILDIEGVRLERRLAGSDTEVVRRFVSAIAWW